MLRSPWKENFIVRNAPSATDVSFVLVAGYSLLYGVVHLLLRRNTLFLRNNSPPSHMASSSPLPLPLAAPLLSSVSCFVFGFGTGYCGSALRLQKSHRFFWIWGMVNPLQRIYNKYEIQISVESTSISVSFLVD